MIVRIGLPEHSGALIAAARDIGAPVLVSANRAWDDRSRRFRSPRGLDGMDCALDSSGFVAMRLYNGYRWTVPEYVLFARSRPWAWWAAMDYCCEPEIAANRGEVLSRVARTVNSYAECVAESGNDQGLLPVLQGRLPSDYVGCAAQLDRIAPSWRAAPIVGVGSVCRRPVGGTDGLLAVVRAVARALAGRQRVHRFGAKSGALTALASEGLSAAVASTDSSAWDFAARVRARSEGRPCRMPDRIASMRDWSAGQALATQSPAQGWLW